MADVPDRTRSQRRLQLLASWVAVTVASVGLVGAALQLSFMDSLGAVTSTAVDQEVFNRLMQNERELAALRTIIESGTSKTVERNSPEDLSRRLGDLESAISHDPATALSVPLIRKDLTNLENQLSSANAAIDRVYDQNKWFIGLMITLLVTIFGLGLANLWRRPSTNGEAEAPRS